MVIQSRKITYYIEGNHMIILKKKRTLYEGPIKEIMVLSYRPGKIFHPAAIMLSLPKQKKPFYDDFRKNSDCMKLLDALSKHTVFLGLSLMEAQNCKRKDAEKLKENMK